MTTPRTRLPTIQKPSVDSREPGWRHAEVEERHHQRVDEQLHPVDTATAVLAGGRRGRSPGGYKTGGGALGPHQGPLLPHRPALLGSPQPTPDNAPARQAFVTQT